MLFCFTIYGHDSRFGQVTLKQISYLYEYSIWSKSVAKPKSKKGHNLVKILSMITKFDLDLYLAMLYPSVNKVIDQNSKV